MMAPQTRCERRSENGPEHCQHFQFQKLPFAVALALPTPTFLIQTDILWKQQRLCMS